ncbi:FMN-binding negative transcriptional regulator [Aestuariivita boseongensis]|uniref:FMN-binding negative transcriptional regulator n=1 Tax=Aestuariivita boseongensis TaxID=1470562 RepID=UPI00068140A4|nr:FMN-binding negative transcriptional regulator [Aestuariivita boseongensis]
MHPNPIYHTQEAQANLAFARARAFGVLAVACGDDAPMLSHVPFLLDEDGVWAHLHLVRSNPIARALRDGPLNARIAVSGPDSYVSPDWYGVADQVPTWNYIAVHLTGQLELRPQEELHGLLDRLSAHFETQLLPKTPWTSAKMSEGVMEKMMRQIVPCAFKVADVDGTWKMNQNKPDEVRLRAADGVARNGMGTDTEALADRMRKA